MKQNNSWRIVWVVSIYAALITILYLVVVYKVKWEDADLSKYNYFYKCGSNMVCTTDQKVTDYYSRVKCTNNVCPRILDVRGDILLIGDDNNNYLFDYRNSKVINDTYQKYKFSSDSKAFIAVDNNGKYGVVNADKEIMVNFNYNKIVDYLDEIILYEENDLLAINDINNSILVAPKYKEIKLFTKDKFIYGENNSYVVAYIKDSMSVNGSQYDYVYPYNNMLLVVKNSQLDILGSDMKSKLSSKINTYYTYTKEEERDSLQIEYIDNLLIFYLYNEDNTYTKYIYDTKNNKLH